MKFCLFGAGRMGMIHAANLARSKRGTLNYVVDKDIQRAKTLAKQYGCFATTHSSEALADSKIDAVIIASATDTHADFIEAAVNADKAVLCEKPIDLRLERVIACENAIQGFGKPVMIGFQRRFDETHMTLQKAIAEGEIGTVESITITSRDPSPPPYDYIKTSGGQFLDQMIHDFDLALWISGASGLTKVFAIGSALIDPKIGELGDTDSAHVLVQFASGAFCKIECSRRATFGYDQRIEVFGALGMMSSTNLHNSAVEKWTSKAVAARATLKPDFMQRYLPCYAMELEAFMDTVEGVAFSGPNFVAGRRALQLACAARQSKTTGLPVNVELY